MAKEIPGNTLELALDDEPVVCPCLELVLLRDVPLGEAELDFYRKAREALGPLLTRYFTRGKKKGSTLADADEVISTWVRRPRVFKRYHILFEGPGPGASPATLEMMLVARRPNPTPEQAEQEWNEIKAAYETGQRAFSPPVTVLRATFPLDGPMADPKALHGWVLGLEAVRDGGLVSGLAGLSLTVDEDADPEAREEAGRHLASVLLRHPGLDWYETSVSFNHALRWEPKRSDFTPLVHRANWLTIVSGRAVALLGGEAALRGSLEGEPGIVLHEAGPNLLIQAGPRPELGDVGRREFLPAYRAVAAALRPVRFEHVTGLGRAFSGEVPVEWLEGLDRSYE